MVGLSPVGRERWLESVKFRSKAVKVALSDSVKYLCQKEHKKLYENI